MNKKLFLWVFFAVLVIGIVFFSKYKPYDGKITHDFPATINAADPASRVSDAENVVLTHRLKYEPPWYAIGYEGRVQAYPPLMLVLVASLNVLSGIEIFDLYFFVGVLVTAGIAIGWFLYFRKCWNNPWLAAIAAVLLAHPVEKFYHYMLTIGIYSNYFAGLFIPYALVFFDRMIKKPSKKNIAGFGIVAGMQFLTHPSASVPFIGFLLLYGLVVHREKIGWKNIMLAGIVYSLIAAPYVPLFYQTFVVINKEGGAFSIKDPEALQSPAWEPNVDFGNLLHPVLYVLAVLGLIVSFMKPKFWVPAAVALFYITFTMILTKFGIGEYYLSVRTRYLLFVVLYPLAAIGLYTVLQSARNNIAFLKNLDKAKVWGVFVVALLVLSVFAVKNIRADGARLFNQEKYNDFLWLRKNSPETAVVLCLGCQQFEGFVTRRVVLQPMYWDEKTIRKLAAIAQGNVSDGNTSIGTEYTGHSEGFPLQKGFLRYELADHKSYGTRDICDVDYVIIKGHPQLTPVFQAIGQRMLEKNASIVRQSQQMIILKNNNKGGDCV